MPNNICQVFFWRISKSVCDHVKGFRVNIRIDTAQDNAIDRCVGRAVLNTFWFQVTIIPRIRIATEESEYEYYDLDQKEGNEMVYRKELVHR